MKVCSKCGELKKLSEFYKESSRKDGKCIYCKQCKNESKQNWRIKNREKQNKYTRQYFIKHPEYGKRYWNEHPKFREKCIEYTKQWRIANPEKLKQIRKKSNAKQRSSPKGKLNHNMSNAIYQTIKNCKSNRHWEDLVGYTIKQLKGHLEKRFKAGMTWDNYGISWHIDHKIPIAVFNFEKPDEIDFRLCWSLKNLQPLEAKQNLQKHSRLEKSFQPSLRLAI